VGLFYNAPEPTRGHYEQEAVLTQADRATRCVSRNVVNCRKKLCNTQQIHNKCE